MSQGCLLLRRQRRWNNSAAWMAVGRQQQSPYCSAAQVSGHPSRPHICRVHSCLLLCGRICPSCLVSRAGAVRAVGSSCCSSGSDWVLWCRGQIPRSCQKPAVGSAREAGRRGARIEHGRVSSARAVASLMHHPPRYAKQHDCLPRRELQPKAQFQPIAAGDFEAPARGAAQGSRGPGPGSPGLVLAAQRRGVRESPSLLRVFGGLRVLECKGSGVQC